MAEREPGAMDDEAGDAVPRGVPVTARWQRSLYFVAGIFMLVLAVIGALLPVMPTTIFVILAAWCFGRSSPRLEAWLLAHPRFGPALVAWRREGAIPKRAKAFAAGGMALGFVIFLETAHPGWPLALLVAALIGACAAYVLSRPAPASER
jgi:uncharacterized protein